MMMTNISLNPTQHTEWLPQLGWGRRMLRTVATQAVDGNGRILQWDTAASLCRFVGRLAYRQCRVPAEKIHLPSRRVSHGQKHDCRDDYRPAIEGQRRDSASSPHLQTGQSIWRDARHQLPHAGGKKPLSLFAPSSVFLCHSPFLFSSYFHKTLLFFFV